MSFVAIVLAAGSSRRFGSDKLSTLFRGEPLVFHAIRAARAAPVERIVVVAHEALHIGDWPGQPPVEACRVSSHALSASLKAGFAMEEAADGIFVFLGDMPLVPDGVAAQLANRMGSGFAAMPRHAGRPGHPVLLSRRAFPYIAELEGDSGAGSLLRSRDDVVFVESQDPGVVFDVDQPEDMARLTQL